MEAVIDGKEGCVILNPTKEEITEYTAKKEKYLKDKEELNKYRNKATKTADSIEIELFGNIGMSKIMTVKASDFSEQNFYLWKIRRFHRKKSNLKHIKRQLL